ncbi:hypothetical protein BDV98DRAFT_519354 [Pterulicium gracile]|uniref:Beta-glucuronidase C-terminal domain-containing protein n=1 Tax=Pterulicium gracile TaxID=1884261 RepID=A0A5C3R003_9AGAR|nr:hypothetical protein BDV98DRAFT_519354 [Pterula gracilis]
MLSSRSLTHLLFASSLVAAVTVTTDFPGEPPEVNRHNVVDDNYFGISWELSSFHSLWGNTTESTPHALLNYLSNYKARLTHPLRIRIGGNGMDGSHYDAGLTHTMLEITDDSYFNAIDVRFGPMFYHVLNEVAERVGDMEFIVQTSMQNPGDVNTYLPLAKDAKHILGDRLDAIVVGNEPDLYAGHHVRPGYWLPDYIPEIEEVIQQFKDADLMDDNTTFMAGPGVCCMWSMDEVFDAGLDRLPYKYYTAQHYPHHACEGLNDKNTNLTYYRQHTNVREYIGWEQSAVDIAKARDIPVLLTEYNTAACGGTNLSDTFTATLWALDVGLQAAALNYSAAYMHTRELGVRYNLFDPPTAETSYLPNWRTGSPYYSGLVMSEVFSPDGSIVVDVSNSTHLQASSNSSSSLPSFRLDETAAYAIYDKGGSARGKMVLINYSGGGPSKEPVTFRIPSSTSDSSRAFAYRLLVAPSATSRTPESTDGNFGEESEITWAGQFVGSNGELVGGQVTQEIAPCTGGSGEECVVEIEVPSPGAVVVLYDTERTDVFYEGNSTVVGYASVYRAPPEGAAVGLGAKIGGVGLAGLMGVLALMY